MDPIRLHAYVDGELGPETAEVREAIARSEELQREVAMIASLKAFVAAQAVAPECDAEWSRAAERLQELRRVRRTESFVGRYAWALCGVFAVAIVVGGVNQRNARGSTVRTGDLLSMVASPIPWQKPSAPTSDPRITEFLRQTRERIDPNRLQVVKLACAPMGDVMVSRFVLRDASGDTLLLAVRGRADFGETTEVPGTSFRAGQVNGQNFIGWHDGETSLLLMGPRSVEGLRRIADRIGR